MRKDVCRLLTKSFSVKLILSNKSTLSENSVKLDHPFFGFLSLEFSFDLNLLSDEFSDKNKIKLIE